MKFKVYRANVDEETGEWWRTFLGHVLADTEADARVKAVESFGANHGPGGWNNTGQGDLRIYPAGTRVKLRGVLNRKSHNNYARAYYDSQPWWNR